MKTYTREQNTLDAMVAVATIDRALSARAVFEITHRVAQVMRDRCHWNISALEADNVAKDITHRLGL